MTNIALNKSATASAQVLPFSASRAVDGALTPTSRWVCNAAPPHWMAVDLGGICWVNRWVVVMMGCVGWSPNYNMPTLTLQGTLDAGRNWFGIDTVTTHGSSRIDRTFVPRKVQSIRVWAAQGIEINGRVSSIVELEVYDAPNPPYLSNVVLTGGVLSPGFDSKVVAYSTMIPSTTQTITLTPSAPAGNTIKVDGSQVTSGQSVEVPVPSVGCQVRIDVISADSSMTETYTINVSREAESAYLSSLVVIGLRGLMTPAFGREIYAYSGVVSPEAGNVKVTPTAEDTQAIITVAGVQTTSGAETTVNLSVGENPIPIVVEASDHSHTSTYTVTVNRPVAEPGPPKPPSSAKIKKS